MIFHVLDTALQVQPAGVHVVFNPDMPEVLEACDSYDITWAEQDEQLGTGHAVLQAMPGVPDNADVLVLYGDIPLLEPGELERLIESPSPGASMNLQVMGASFAMAVAVSNASSRNPMPLKIKGLSVR
jgi:bifunctional N-acetylglucosamine-1-phosphate-uridyltransferase/glucosamine-1-phosphate-acetyltransferase GlmU-like protein